MCHWLPMAKYIARWIWHTVRYYARIAKHAAYLLVCYQCVFYFFPFLVSFSTGFLTVQWDLEMNRHRSELFERNLQSAHDINWASKTPVPGLPPPFYTPELRDPTNWYQKLGLRRFDIAAAGHEACSSLDLMRIASLDGLYRRKWYSEKPNSWHHFVYASAQRTQEEGKLGDPWDQAFYDLIQYHNADPAVGSAKFHWLSCPDSFLCNSWLVNGSALLHFTTEKFAQRRQRSAETGGQKIPRSHEAVTVRIIELPMAEQWKLGLPRGTFPSYVNQLRGITGDTLMWRAHVPHSYSRQMARRSKELRPKWEQQYPWTFGLFSKMDRLLSPWLTVETSIWPGFVEAAGVYCGSRIRLWAYFANQLITSRLRKNEKPETRVVVTVDDSPEVDLFKAKKLRDYLDTLEPGRRVIINGRPEVREAYERMLKAAERKEINQEEE